MNTNTKIITIKRFFAQGAIVLAYVILCLMAFWALASPEGLAAPSSDGGSPTSAGSSAVCEAIGSGADCDENANGSANVNGIIELIINILSTLVGVIAVIMIIISGFKYVTAAGDSSKVSSAKSTLIYALVGLIIVALAQLIVRFVLKSVTDAGS